MHALLTLPRAWGEGEAGGEKLGRGWGSRRGFWFKYTCQHLAPRSARWRTVCVWWLYKRGADGPVRHRAGSLDGKKYIQGFGLAGRRQRQMWLVRYVRWKMEHMLVGQGCRVRFGFSVLESGPAFRKGMKCLRSAITKWGLSFNVPIFTIRTGTAIRDSGNEGRWCMTLPLDSINKFTFH